MQIPTKETDTYLVKHLSMEELQFIFDAPGSMVRHGIRNRAMLHLCFAGGLRVSELIGIRLDDLKLQPQGTVLIHGKRS